MKSPKYIGVDGCKAGWFFVAIGSDNAFELGICENIKKLWQRYSSAKWILIDIPIGLPSKRLRTRSCDRSARQVLGPKRHHSIFSPPCREALAADSYPEACRLNREVCGRKISKQVWYICLKIKEVDDLMSICPAARNKIKETHPEVCFWALAGKRPMRYYKKHPRGEAERLAVLNSCFALSPTIVKTALDRYLRKQLARDDILDALVNAVTAIRLDRMIKTLPSEPTKDALGLPMQMVYTLP